VIKEREKEKEETSSGMALRKIPFSTVNEYNFESRQILLWRLS
jgi:hypothetical protein